MTTTAQFALYPLGTAHTGPAIMDALTAARATGVTVEEGRMTSTLEGTDEQVFAALRAAFRIVATQGDAVLVVTISNAC